MIFNTYCENMYIEICNFINKSQKFIEIIKINSKYNVIYMLNKAKWVLLLLCEKLKIIIN